MIYGRISGSLVQISFTSLYSNMVPALEVRQWAEGGHMRDECTRSELACSPSEWPYLMTLFKSLTCFAELFPTGPPSKIYRKREWARVRVQQQHYQSPTAFLICERRTPDDVRTGDTQAWSRLRQKLRASKLTWAECLWTVGTSSRCVATALSAAPPCRTMLHFLSSLLLFLLHAPLFAPCAKITEAEVVTVERGGLNIGITQFAFSEIRDQDLHQHTQEWLCIVLHCHGAS